MLCFRLKNEISFGDFGAKIKQSGNFSNMFRIFKGWLYDLIWLNMIE